MDQLDKKLSKVIGLCARRLGDLSGKVGEWIS